MNYNETKEKLLNIKDKIIKLLETHNVSANNENHIITSEILDLFYEVQQSGKFICFSCGSLDCKKFDGGILCNKCLHWQSV